MGDSGFVGSGATPGWRADVLWIVGICWFEGLSADAKMVFVGCESVQENVSARAWRMQEGQWSMTNFSFLFLLSFPFFFSILSLVSWSCGASGSSFSRGRVFKNGVRFHFLSWTIWKSLSIAGLNVIVISQDGPRCESTRTATVFFGRERPRMPARCRLCSSSVRVQRSAGVINRGRRSVYNSEAAGVFRLRRGGVHTTFSRMPPLLGLAGLPLHGACPRPGRLLNKWGRGWREEGCKSAWPAF